MNPYLKSFLEFLGAHGVGYKITKSTKSESVYVRVGRWRFRFSDHPVSKSTSYMLYVLDDITFEYAKELVI